MLEIKLHPLVKEPAKDAVYHALKDDISQHGQILPVLAIKGPINGDMLVFDGARRVRACEELGLKVKLKEWDGDVAGLPRTIESLKLLREHLSPGQRAAYALVIEQEFTAEARKREISGTKVDPVANLPQGYQPGRSRDKAAALCGVSARYLSDCKIIRANAPDLFAKIQTNELNICQAMGKLRRRQEMSKIQEASREISKVRRMPLADKLELIVGDNVKVLAGWKRCPFKPRVVFADPPYNNCTRYDADPTGDDLDDEAFLDRVRLSLARSVDVMADDGTLYVLIDARFVGRFDVMLRDLGLHWQNTIVWWNHFPKNRRDKYPAAGKFVLVFTKRKSGFIWHPPLVETVRNAIGDARGITAGKVPDNIWPVNMVPGNSGDRAPFEDMPPQLPIELPLRCILASSEPGDEVLDPYHGNGTTAIAALMAGRYAIGIDRSAKYITQSKILIGDALGKPVPPHLAKIIKGEV